MLPAQAGDLASPGACQRNEADCIRDGRPDPSLAFQIVDRLEQPPVFGGVL